MLGSRVALGNEEGLNLLLAAAVALTHLLGALQVDEHRMAWAAGEAATWATDVAEWLVARGMPFRQAHHVTGELVARLEDLHIDLGAATDDLLASIHAELTAEVRDLADPRRSLAARSTPGGTAPERVKEQLADLRSKASSHRS